MKHLLFAAALALTALGCHTKNDRNSPAPERQTPACILEKIRQYPGQSCPSGASVREYIFQGQTVYVFAPGNCGADMATHIWDARCSYLGFLDGLMGNQHIGGVNFRDNATYVRTLWAN